MDKQQLLAELHAMTASGEVSREEILGVLQVSAADARAAGRHMNISEVLYYIGGGIVFLGICVLIYQNWDFFGSPVKVMVAFGSFVAAAVIGVLLDRYEGFKKLAQAFFLLAGLLAPLGIRILFKETGVDISSDTIQVGMYALLIAVFFGLFWKYRYTILLFFGILFCAACFHFVINAIVGSSLLAQDASKVWEYRFLTEGLVFICLGYYFSRTPQRGLSGVLYGFGSLGFLGAALALGGWQPNQNAFWELAYPVLVFGLIFASVYVKSRALLVFGALFLIAYILKLTGEYFTTGLGWPLALVLAGLLIMGVGYYAVRINRKYLTSISLK